MIILLFLYGIFLVGKNWDEAWIKYGPVQPPPEQWVVIKPNGVTANQSRTIYKFDFTRDIYAKHAEIPPGRWTVTVPGIPGASASVKYSFDGVGNTFKSVASINYILDFKTPTTVHLGTDGRKIEVELRKL